MAEDSEIRNKINSTSDQKYQAEQNKAAIDRKLERLYKAKEQVASEKAAIDELRGAVRNQENPADVWKGQYRNNYCYFVQGEFHGYYDTYFEETDALLDSIVREITKLENESLCAEGLIGRLSSVINSLWHDLETMVN